MQGQNGNQVYIFEDWWNNETIMNKKRHIHRQFMREIVTKIQGGGFIISTLMMSFMDSYGNIYLAQPDFLWRS